MRGSPENRISPWFFVLGFTLLILQYQNCAPNVGAGAFNIGSAAATSPYSSAVLADTPAYYWKLNDSSATTFVDSSGNNNYALGTGSITPGQQPFSSTMDGGAVALAGTNAYITTQNNVAAPTTFSLELWFKTTTGGGKLLGFGNAQTGASTTYDRQIYMSNSGNLYFGIYGGTYEAIASPGTYIDGNWHYVVATFSTTTGAALYVDGNLVSTGAPVTLSQYNGYWRIAYDAVISWPNAPSNAFFIGSLDEVAIYNGALSLQQITNHYTAAR